MRIVYSPSPCLALPRLTTPCSSRRILIKCLGAMHRGPDLTCSSGLQWRATCSMSIRPGLCSSSSWQSRFSRFSHFVLPSCLLPAFPPPLFPRRPLLRCDHGGHPLHLYPSLDLSVSAEPLLSCSDSTVAGRLVEKCVACRLSASTLALDASRTSLAALNLTRLAQALRIHARH